MLGAVFRRGGGFTSGLQKAWEVFQVLLQHGEKAQTIVEAAQATVGTAPAADEKADEGLVELVERAFGCSISLRVGWC